jgi:hypothetical protein
MNKQFIKFTDKLYLLNRKVLDDPKYTGTNLDDLMKFFNANKVLRKDGYLFFLEEVEEAHIIDWLPKEN